MDDAYRRDQLWKAAYYTAYDVHFDELLSDALVKRWMLVDDIAKIAMAVSASGSAIAGWTLWSDPAFKPTWAIIAGFGAMAAIIHTTLGVVYRLRDHGETKNRLIRLRIELDTFRIRMAANPEFDVEDFEEQLLKFRERYSNDCFKRNDVLITDALRRTLQEELNSLLRYPNESTTQ
jgi:hypothetical protein